MARPSPNNSKQRRIIQLSHEWGVNLPPAPARLERPQSLPTYRVPGDDITAEDILQRHAIEISQARPRSGLTRAFSTNSLKKRKTWDPRHILEVLTTWISNAGSAGVAEALMAKLTASGADLGAMQVQKSGILSRRKSLEGFVDRTKLFRMAVQNNDLELVHVLLPHADPLSLDACLPVAIRQGNLPIAEILLRYGASVAQTAEGQDAFRQACGVPLLASLVGYIVQSDGRPSTNLASQCMVDAARVGSLDTVMQLSRSVADGDYNHAEALRVSVELGRADIAVAIVMGNKPPHSPGVTEAFAVVIKSQSIPPATKLQISELLLCAGAEGDVLSQALQAACDSHFYEMASLLAAHGVSIEYDGASVLKTAIRQGQVDLVCSLLNDSATLSPSLASACVTVIPKETSKPERYLLLTLLLKKGAKGTPLDEMLVMSAEDGDQASVELLVKPYFPGSPLDGVPSSRVSSGRQVHDRHETASPDHKDGEALRTAVLRADTNMVSMILMAQPSSETLSTVFPLTKNLPQEDRYHIVEQFLKGALTGPPLHSALQDSIADEPPTRDDKLIKLLLAHGADINFSHGTGLRAIILQGDIPLFQALVPRASPQTMAAQIPDVMTLADHRMRHDIMALIFQAGGSIGLEEVSSALLDTLREKPVDMSLLKLMLHQGSADVNNPNFPVFTEALRNPDPKVLDSVLALGKPSPATIAKTLGEIVSLPPTDGKARKLKSTLGKSRSKEDLGSLLALEVQSLVNGNPRQPPSLSSLHLLLEHGADPNEYQAAALCYAVSAANMPICDILLGCQRPPNEASLGGCLPHALKIPDNMDRMSFTKKLIAAGAPPKEVNRGLVHAIAQFADDIFLIDALATAADTSDGEAIALAVTKESPQIVELLLSRQRHCEESKIFALDRAMSVKDRSARRKICQAILNDGVSPGVASNALLVAARDGDLELGDILMANGASISSNGGQAIVEACRGGSPEVLEVLLRTEAHPDKVTLERGFQAATEVRDLNKRAVIFEKLLKRGVSGEPVDAQLTSAARYGEGGQEVLRVLLEAGADPNYNCGEAVVAATRSAFTGNLDSLLGLWDEEGRQRKPSHPTLLRALKASWNLSHDTRLRVVASLFKAGLPAVDEVHMALNDAANEEDPDPRLIKHLLDHGASPTANDCKTLLDAARQGARSPTASATLIILLEYELPKQAIERAFAEYFRSDNFDEWYSEDGKRTMGVILEKGIKGGPLSKALLLIMRGHTTETTELSHEFFTMIVRHEPDVNYNGGEVLQEAAAQANVAWTSTLLTLQPSTESLSYSFQRIFDTRLDEDDALKLFDMFSSYRHGETRVDVMTQNPGIDPVLVRAMSQYPRSTRILETLLDAGFYHDQATFGRIHPDIDEVEEMTPLIWALAQPQKRISSSLIRLLLDRGSKVNAETRLSQTTPVMLAIQSRRPDVVKMLLLEGAEVDVTDFLGRSPLSMATDLGGDLAIEIMASILAADPGRDDGSLHNAAREMNLPAVKTLIQAGHDPDFPSPQHDGRSALGEVCLKSSDGCEMTAESEKTMQKLVTYLIDQGSDLTIKSEGKGILHLCFDAGDPVVTTRVFLKAGMWKRINEPFSHYTDGTFTYSPTMYVKKLLPETDTKARLLQLLYANRATDVFYANDGHQPNDAVGLPDDMKALDRARKARLERMAEESEDFALAMARKREQASVESKIAAQKAEMEDARRRKLQSEDAATMRSRAALQESLESAAHQKRMAEQRALGDASAARVRAIAAAEVEAEDARRRKVLEWDGRANQERVENARTISAIRVGEREELSRIERGEDERMARRLEAQKQLIAGQERLARSIAAGPGGGAAAGGPRRQIGYVTEMN